MIWVEDKPVITIAVAVMVMVMVMVEEGTTTTPENNEIPDNTMVMVNRDRLG